MRARWPTAQSGRIALQDVPEWVPAPGEVLVDVRAFAINRGEMRMLGTATDGWRPGWTSPASCGPTSNTA